jgi:hypothetical protein
MANNDDWQDVPIEQHDDWQDVPVTESKERAEAEKEGLLTTGIKKVLQGASYNFSDELAGGAEALGSLAGYRGVGGPVKDIRKETQEEAQQGFGDVYRSGRDAERARQRGQSAAFPKTSLIAEMGGSLLTAPVSGGGGTLAKIGTTAADAGLMGLGSSEADVTKGDVSGALRDTAIAGGIGGGTAALTKGVGAAADKTGLTDAAKAGYDALTEKLPAYLRNFAEERATKAALGQNAKAFKELQAQRTAEGTGVNKVGRDLLSKDEHGAPLVGWLSRAENIAPRAKERMQQFGKDIGAVGETTEALMPNPVQGTDISQNILDWAAKNVPEGPQFDTVRDKLLKNAEFYEQSGAMPWDKAQELKRNLVFKQTNPYTQEIGKEATNALNRSVSDAMDSAVERASQTGNATPDQQKQLQLYQYLKDKYGSFKTAAQGATDRTAKNLSNRLPSPSDMLAGAVFGGGNYLGGDQSDPLRSIAIGGSAIMGNRFARTRGSALAARTSDAIANLIEKGGAQGAKYGAYLQRLYQDRGPEAAAGALYILLKNDPKARETLITQGAQP